MRIWHKDLIDVLPNQQLIGQWRELCLIAKNLHLDGTPHHILVNPVVDFPLDHLVKYAEMIYTECWKRGFHGVDWERFHKWVSEDDYSVDQWDDVPVDELFAGWHNNRYLMQCFYNLQEKFDRLGISKEEFIKVNERMVELNGE